MFSLYPVLTTTRFVGDGEDFGNGPSILVRKLEEDHEEEDFHRVD